MFNNFLTGKLKNVPFPLTASLQISRNYAGKDDIRDSGLRDQKS
jgi:hypothetical protein